jgi:formate dehydrogenase subunit delta
MTSLQTPESRLGNDITRQFAHLPHDEAVASITEHIKRFWDPRMRANLVASANAGEDTLDPLLAAAAARL